MRVLCTVIAALTLLGATGCNKQIPNTTVADNDHNRQVLDFMEVYRKAVEKRDVDKLLTLAHPQYLDDNGTPLGDDDLDFERLREKLSKWRERVKDVRYEIKYRKITGEQDKIFVEFRYAASFRLGMEEEPDRWSRRIGEHRVTLTRDPGSPSFLFLSGM